MNIKLSFERDSKCELNPDGVISQKPYLISFIAISDKNESHQNCINFGTPFSLKSAGDSHENRHPIHAKIGTPKNRFSPHGVGTTGIDRKSRDLPLPKLVDGVPKLVRIGCRFHENTQSLQLFGTPNSQPTFTRFPEPVLSPPGLKKSANRQNRRSYARHRDRRNQQRNQKRWAQQGRITVQLTDQPLDEATITQIREHPGIKQIQFDTQLPDVGYSAVLQVYRRAVDAPLVAISGEVWRGGQKEADIAPISCATLTPRQV